MDTIGTGAVHKNKQSEVLQPLGIESAGRHRDG